MTKELVYLPSGHKAPRAIRPEDARFVPAHIEEGTAYSFPSMKPHHYRKSIKDQWLLAGTTAAPDMVRIIPEAVAVEIEANRQARKHLNEEYVALLRKALVLGERAKPEDGRA